MNIGSFSYAMSLIPQIPPILPILPLPTSSILFPSLVISLRIRVHRSALIATLRDLDMTRYPLIACVPLQPSLCSPTQRNEREEERTKVLPGDLCDWGCAARIICAEQVDGGEGIVAVLEGVTRVRIERYVPSGGEHLAAEVTVVSPSTLPDNELLNPLSDAVRKTLNALATEPPLLSVLISSPIRSFTETVRKETAGSLADVIVSVVPNGFLRMTEKVEVLSTVDVEARIRLVVEMLNGVEEGVEETPKDGKRKGEEERRRKEWVLRNQMAQIRRELDEMENKDYEPGKPLAIGFVGGKTPEHEEEDDLADLKRRLDGIKLANAEAYVMAMREFKRFTKIAPQSVEYGVVRTYIEWLADLPWAKETKTNLAKEFIVQARERLEREHYGLEQVKKRLLEWLVVLKLRMDEEVRIKTERLAETKRTELAEEEKEGKLIPALLGGAEAREGGEIEVENVLPRPRYKGPILCLIGPPGVGKTSIAKSLAESMGRKFTRISLGGVRDEAEIRGHRRTYVAAMPGLIVQALKEVGVNNPVILLDQIDNIGMNNHQGNPSAAILEVLDPEQNYQFNDHYINTPVDLSKIVFIATAHTLETIYAPLLDRMETIQISGYVYDEKLEIAKRHLLPKQLSSNVLSPSHFSISDDTILHLIAHYTREAGVRNLEREIGSIVRAKRVEWSDVMGSDCEKTYNHVVKKEDLERILGPGRWEVEVKEGESEVGVVNGLAYMGSGNGGLLIVECRGMPGAGNLKLTGSLGDVIKESAQIAHSWVRANGWNLGISATQDEDVTKNLDIHLHLPSGDIPKDGSSAGIAMVISLVSLLTRRKVPSDIAMTGEITLRGTVTRVGGLKEKILAAHRAGVKKVICPFGNNREVESELAEKVSGQVDLIFVKKVEEVLDIVFGEKVGSKGKVVWEEKERKKRVKESRSWSLKSVFNYCK
ncbi:ATP-dependent protease La [Atractiella rhizophila]|nr:ATP-dependent protease La [Atractiella rhizophila]